MKNNTKIFCIICFISVLILLWSLSRNNLVENFENKENIAIIFSGNLRTYKECFPTFKKNILDILIPKYNIDIYCHFWDNEEKQQIEEAIKLYNPKKYVIDKQINYILPDFCHGLYFHKSTNISDILKSIKDKKFPYNTIQGHVNQKYGIFKGNLLSKEINNYKFKFRIRYDNYFTTKLDINDINEIKNKEIYVGYGHTKYLNNYQTNVNDAFAYGLSNDMDNYFSFYTHISDILKSIKDKELPDHYNYLYKCIAIELLYKFYLDYILKLKFKISSAEFGLKRSNGEMIFFKNCHYGYIGEIFY